MNELKPGTLLAMIIKYICRYKGVLRHRKYTCTATISYKADDAHNVPQTQLHD